MPQKSLKLHPLLKWGLITFICIALGLGIWSLVNGYWGINQTKYQTVMVEEGPIIATIRASGTLNPVRSVTIGTGVSGMIRELTVDFNDKVKQGQVIARIDQREFQARYDQAFANFELASKNHEYNLNLMKEGFISQQAAVATENAVKANLGALNLAKKSLDDTLIRSPVDGVVVKRSVEVGQTVAASLQSPEIFIIARNLAEMQVETSIDESDVGRIEEGQEATFTVDAFPNKTFRGRVKQIRKAPVNIQNVVTYTVLITADNPDLKLLPGMTANARIMVDQRDLALKVLSTALRFRMPQAPNAAKTANNSQASPPPWWKFWESKDASTNLSGATNPSNVRSSGTNSGASSTQAGPPGARSNRAGAGGSGQGNFRSVYVLEKNGNQEIPVRKAFRLGLTDGEYSEILPLRDRPEAELKVGDLVITGIEGPSGRSGTGTNPSPARGSPRMF